MDNKKQIEAIIKELGQTIGIPDLALDEEDGCVIGFDNKVEVNLQYIQQNNSLILYSNLGRVNTTVPPELFAEMLEANFHEGVRGGCIIGYQRKTRIAWSIYHLNTGNIGPHAFEAILENFVNYSEAWGKRIQDATGAESDQAVSPDQSIPPGMKV